MYTYGAAVIKYSDVKYMFLSKREEYGLRRNLAEAAMYGRPTVRKLMALKAKREVLTSNLLKEDW